MIAEWKRGKGEGDKEVHSKSTSFLSQLSKKHIAKTYPPCKYARRDHSSLILLSKGSNLASELPQ